MLRNGTKEESEWRGEETAEKHAGKTDGGRRSEKGGGSGDGRRKVPWRNSLRVSMAR